MSLALGAPGHPEDMKRFVATGSMDNTLVGSMIDGMRVFVTSCENSGIQDPVANKINRFFVTAATLVTGLVVAPLELTGRVGKGFVLALMHNQARLAGNDSESYYLDLLVKEAKTIVATAKVWVFFSNPVTSISYMILNLLPDSYQRLSIGMEPTPGFFESALTTENLSRRNAANKIIHEVLVAAAEKQYSEGQISTAFMATRAITAGVAETGLSAMQTVGEIALRTITTSAGAIAEGATQLVFTNQNESMRAFRDREFAVLAREAGQLGMLTPWGAALSVAEYALDALIADTTSAPLATPVVEIEVEGDGDRVVVIDRGAEANPFSKKDDATDRPSSPASDRVAAVTPSAASVAASTASEPVEFNPFAENTEFA